MSLSKEELDTLKKCVFIKRQIDNLTKYIEESNKPRNQQIINLEQNPFPSPLSIEETLNREIIGTMNTLIERKELTLYTFFDKIEESIKSNKQNEAAIWSFYCYNVLKKVDEGTRRRYLEDILDLFRTLVIEENENEKME